tara:strand:- start:333 stop:1148 length:816 start_codon:yes stop_codon:yes gene_type:complete
MRCKTNRAVRESLRAIFCLFALCAASSQALTVPVTFSVDVQTRQTHDGLGGFRDTNWMVDSSFTGGNFLLGLVLDIQDTDIEVSDFQIGIRSSSTGTLQSPFTPEVMSYYAGEEVTGDLSFAISEVLLADSRVGVSTGRTETNHVDPFQSTQLTEYSYSLNHSYENFKIFHPGGFPVQTTPTAEDVRDGLLALYHSGASFDFIESGTIATGTVTEYLNSTAQLTGLRYTGTATLVAVGDMGRVSVPATASLLMFGLVIMAKSRKAFKGSVL